MDITAVIMEDTMEAITEVIMAGVTITILIVIVEDITEKIKLQEQSSLLPSF